MNPLRVAIEAAVQTGMDFLLVVGGEPALRQQMGLPVSVLDRQPLLLAFQAAHHRNSKPVCDEGGVSCVLSFDTLCECRIPYSAMLQLVLQPQMEARWPDEWRSPEQVEATVESAKEPPPDNVRQFRPRSKNQDG